MVVRVAHGPHGTVVESLGHVWVLSIEPAGRQSPPGARVAEVGPLPVVAGTAYTAQYMEAVFRPGMKSTIHRHGGPEAWYTLAGDTCLETPGGGDGGARRRSQRHRAAWPADGVDRNRHQNPARDRAHPSRHRAASHNARRRLDAEGTVHHVNRAVSK